MSDVSHALRRLSCAAAFLALAAAGCSHPAPAGAAPTRVGIMTLGAQAMQVSQTLPGRTLAYQVADVRPQVGGILRERLFEEGQEVRAGQPLYRLDPAPYQAAYDVARGNLAQAEAALTAARPRAERYRTLVGLDAASRQDADDALSTLQQDQAAVVAARAALEQARINLGYTRIVAPIAGRTGTSAYTVGALLTAEQDTALTTIQQLDPIYLDVTQSSTRMLALRQQLDAGRIHAVDGKAQVQVRLEDGSRYPHPGTLEFVGTRVDADTGNVTLRAVVPNPEHLLLPGMYLRAVLPVATDPAAILVPQQAVSRDSKGDPLVKLLDAGDRVVERHVRTGEVVGHDWSVTAGLRPGDRLIVLNGSAVTIGQKVAPYPVSAAQLDALPPIPGGADQAD